MSYQYDVFLSFSRSEFVRSWVAIHFLPVLSHVLDEQLPYRPSLFSDLSIEVGVSWPGQIADALSHSRCMVAILNPPYFRSRWCASEFRTMQARQQMVGSRSPLLLPIVLSGGENLPSDVQQLQLADFRRWSYPVPAFRETPSYLDFYDAMKQLAEVLATRILEAPPWRSDFPIINVEELPQAPQQVTLPRLA